LGSVERPGPCCRNTPQTRLSSTGDRRSWSADPMYFVDSGRPLTGAPPLLKTRRHMRRDAAQKLWLKLQEQGWRQVKPQWGEGVDV